MRKLLRHFIALIIFILLPLVSWAQYNANTSTSVIAYPGTIPCPASSCSGGGSLTGANYTLTPTDFNNPMTRVTDNSSMSTSNSYSWSYSGGAYVLPMNTTDTRFVIYSNPSYFSIPFSWNPATKQATKLYGSSYYIGTPIPYSTLAFSFTQPNVAYGIGFNSSNNPAIYSWDFTSTSTAPTGVQVVDLSTCVAALAGANYQWNDDVIVSQDDQTFAVAISSTAGEGSSGDVYAVVWNRTNGCRVWNTGTGAVSGAWGTTGTINITNGSSDTFTLHGVVLGEGGTYAYVIIEDCLSTCNGSPVWKGYIWNISTLTATGLTANTLCGHSSTGYNQYVDNCSYGGGYEQGSWWRSPLSAINSETPPTGLINPNAVDVPLYTTAGWTDHSSWGTDNPSDTNPFCTVTLNNQFAVSGAFDNEIMCIAMNGAGTTWRFGHTYATYQSPNFEAKNAIGAVSQDGKWFLWTSDWDGMLGNTSGASNTCTLGTNCRNDVFIMALPQTSSSGAAISSGAKLSGGAVISN